MSRRLRCVPRTSVVYTCAFAMASVSSPLAAPVWIGGSSLQPVGCRGLQDLARKVAMHAVAMKPDFMDAAGVSPQALEGAKRACLPTATRGAICFSAASKHHSQ